MLNRPQVIIFDVNETLFSLDAIGDRFAEAGLPAENVQLWFARVLREAFALGCLDARRPFREIGRVELEGLLSAHGVADIESTAKHIFDGFEHLDPYPEVPATFEMLRAAGVRIATLTNGHAEVTERLLKRSGLDGYVERCLSVDNAARWKPFPEPYRFALDVCGVAGSEAAMVAVHSWDLAGAKRAGLTTGYASRLEGGFIPFYPEPDVAGADLVAVAEGLLAFGRDPARADARAERS